MQTLPFTLLMFGLIIAASCSSSPPKSAAANAAPEPTVVQPNQQQNAELTPPETVRSEEVRIVSGVKLVTVGNSLGHYHLSCNAKVDSCVTPMPGKDYLVFSKETRWKMPGAKECCATLKFFQDYSISYNNQENVALVPDGDGRFGMYILDSWNKSN